nr:unnamed protein product [Callosobruchus analis]
MKRDITMDSLRCLTETWCTGSSQLVFHLDGYVLASSYYRSVHKGGGVSIYASRDINYKQLPLRKNLKSVHQLSPIRSRSPHSNQPNFINRLIEVVSSLYKPGITIFVVGDFNVDSSCNSQEYQNLCKALNIFDYCHIQPHKIPQASRIKRTFNEHSIKSFIDDLSNEPMHELYIERDINEATFSNIFLHYFEKHFPKRRRFTSFNRNKEWVTEEVRRSSCNLKNLYYLKLCHPELEPSYKVENSRHAQLIKETKKFFYQCKILQSDNPLKSAWSTINQLSNENRIQNQLAIAHNGQKVDDTKQIANLFNEYFRDSPINISKRVNQRATQNNTDIGTLTRIVQDTIFLFPYAPNELYNLINEKMRNKCTSGYDEVPMFLVKKVMPMIILFI